MAHDGAISHRKPWDERYVYLHEWLDFYGKNDVYCFTIITVPWILWVFGEFLCSFFALEKPELCWLLGELSGSSYHQMLRKEKMARKDGEKQTIVP